MPTALCVWIATIMTVALAPWAGFAVVAAVVALCGCARAVGQAVLVGSGGVAAVVVAWVRIAVARAGTLHLPVEATVTAAPKELASGGMLVRVRAGSGGAELPVFVRGGVPDGVVSGATVRVDGTVSESSRAGVKPWAVNGTVEPLAGPTGASGWAQHVRATFADAVREHVGEHSQGLIPGMVLGDTSMQGASEQQAYIATGLSHLSAVSGSNVAIVTTFAVVVAAALRIGLYGRLVAAGAALAVFALLVGPEPSVLRASVMGLVGLVAVVASSQTEVIHALCLAVIALIFFDTDLAMHYGFALSIAATVGIVVLFPLFYRALAPTALPDILVRAVAVAIAADVATMPLVAAMAGQVSLVSVGANVLVAPVTPLVTVLGLCAVVLAVLPGGLEAIVLWLISPLTWWVHTVAERGAALPAATVAANPVTVLIGYGWVVAVLLLVPWRRRTLALCLTCAVVASACFAWPRGTVVDPATLRSHVVATKDDILPVPSGTELVVVLEEGSAPKRPVATPDGIPVIFPNRGAVPVLYADGRQQLR